MRPGDTRWATNNNWAGGPDVGSPTKTPPTAGQRADARYASYRPAPQVWNYERWEVGQKLMGLEFIRVANWEFCDISALAAGIARADHGGYYEPTTETFVFYSGLAAAKSEEVSVGGLVWAAGAPAGGWGAGAIQQQAHDGSGNRGQVDNVAGNGVYHSAAWGAWAVPAPWAIAGTWRDIEHDWLGLWVIGDNGGVLNQSTGIGVAFAAVTTPPGFAAANVDCILHSHHPAATLYPNDPGNQVWMAITQTPEISTSTDGLNWTAAAAPANLPSPQLNQLAYSAYGSRWIGTHNGTNTLRISDDNGVTWTATGAIPSFFTSRSSIACDGYGNWVFVAGNGAGVQETFVSVDNGDNWTQVYFMPDAAGNTPFSGDTSVFYGGGRFIFTSRAGVTLAIFTSLRADE